MSKTSGAEAGSEPHGLGKDSTIVYARGNGHGFRRMDGGENKQETKQQKPCVCTGTPWRLQPSSDLKSYSKAGLKALICFLVTHYLQATRCNRVHSAGHGAAKRNAKSTNSNRAFCPGILPVSLRGLLRLIETPLVHPENEHAMKTQYSRTFARAARGVHSTISRGRAAVSSSIFREPARRNGDTPPCMHMCCNAVYRTLVSFPPSRIQFIFLVTPGMFIDLATLFPMSRLMRALLPTLGNPITATRTLRGFIPLRTLLSLTLEPAFSAAFLICLGLVG